MKTGFSAATLAVALALLSPLAAADEASPSLSLTPVVEDPVYTSEDMARLAQLDNGIIVQGADLDTPDGYTSGFRLTAGYSPYRLPQFDLGAELTYRTSDEVPLSMAGESLLMNTTSVGGSLVAGVRLGHLGLYAKTGFAEWNGDPLEPGESARLATAGTSRVNGFGARLDFPSVSGQLEFEEIDAPSMQHLNQLTASLHIPF
ncbi:hypothetical protein [Billgrantia gudaonensis]|uniref:Outer membrane protein beta-barrel domain-containing protein n=1 Tax=Billgrantia gudaonensis TaxID=376427 RepID=A0A1G8NGC8_9GAMM|nr:hypothetical protein [Halomonas gudaonensis]SDI79243.1 hypothetical protein SAMN04487954_101324 [Halomonas gudaonensis]